MCHYLKEEILSERLSRQLIVKIIVNQYGTSVYYLTFTPCKRYIAHGFDPLKRGHAITVITL